MAKKTTTTANTTLTVSPDAAPSLTLAILTAMAPTERVDIYVNTERKVNASFLLQGKILSTLPDATDLLKAAGIKPSSLANARTAEWVLSTLPALDEPVLFATASGEKEPFTEAFYDRMTLRQCDLLRKSLTLIGNVKHRPSIPASRAICAEHSDWDDQLESYFDTGLTLAGLTARAAQQAVDAAAERQRVADLEASTAALQAQIAEQAAQLAANPPPPPPVITAPVVKAPVITAPVVTAPAATTEPDDAEPEAEQENEEETVVTPATTPATNVVAFSSASAEPEDEQEETPAAEDEQEDEDNLTPEQVGSAFSDATEDMPSTEGIDSYIAELQDAMVDCIEIADLVELRTWEAELQQMLDLVRTHIAAKAEPQEELPAAKKSKKTRAAA
jgi:hypothetical protein